MIAACPNPTASQQPPLLHSPTMSMNIMVTFWCEWARWSTEAGVPPGSFSAAAIMCSSIWRGNICEGTCQPGWVPGEAKQQ